jgi:hypothetical protein
MSNGFDAAIKDRHEASELSIAVGKVFQPRAPISTREFFAGLSIRSAHRDALYDKVILACAAASSAAKDALGYFHPTDVINPLSSILKRKNVIIATFQKHMNEFCVKERGPVLEMSGVPRAYKYRFHDPLLPPYIFMKAVAAGSITVDEINTLTGSN